MKYTRYVARTIMGDGMTHWYAYYNMSNKGWWRSILDATFFEKPQAGISGSPVGPVKFTMVEVDIEIEEKA